MVDPFVEIKRRVGMTPKAMEERADEVAGHLKTLTHPVRLMLVCTLVEGEWSVGELEEKLDIHQPTLSQQLTVLREARIVETRREGKQIFYRLTEAKTQRLIAALFTIFCAEDEA
ncbi:sulfite-sensing transcriptional repressor BigR [Agrobacterium vitis]|uniref:sulfite-sensing transcriptional repressor BigR n=1 Tax=Agrobacterium vitis TaxID=373 RepID=UPI0015740EFB|nr:sulfite-sensing transcriptional repressor BigR [Agrobacterium vitis]NSZ16286.1 helix-turn-helix transcriptional regulator [Agrobacterium vitis]QZO05047.1 metalloregulator ArsR/SmtB family transcription factor [Agrobacterium vitis]UJL87194.1 helix-turn-helix transcriptional regulator [Agrobacterium vitis]BCH60068.1 transcriptional regulator [Agrobacterium vitis]